MQKISVAWVGVQQAIGVVFSLAFCACGSAEQTTDVATLDTLVEAANVDPGPGPAPSQQPGATDCSGLPEYKAVKLGAALKTASYQRPQVCPGWSGLEAHFKVPSSLPYRKLYVTGAFNYSGPNSGAHCLASKIEYETFRQVEIAGHTMWLPFGQGSATPHWVDSTQLCYWHNYNNGLPGELTNSAPGTYVERIRARGVRYNGTIANVTVAARMQEGTLP